MKGFGICRKIMENNTSQNTNENMSFSDIPQADDCLGMEKRCKGIADFISHCSTPMTLAIQGDWGMGKTSCMKIIGKHLEKSLKEKMCIIEFNTWQFSVLGNDEKIIVDLLQTMIDQLEAWLEKLNIKDDNINRKMDEAKKGIVSMANITASFLKELFLDSTAGKIAASIAENTVKDPIAFLNSIIGAPATRTQTVIEMKKKVEELIDAIIKNPKTGDRVFIFIDDLDRLDPRIAVELMEGLKNFADCKNCVFILAIDQSVVERGLRAKFDKDFDQAKAKKFFDKIIQIPFALPVSDYDITQYIASFSPMGGAEAYASILNSFNEKNPRTIKRSFNTLNMNLCIEKARNSDNKNSAPLTQQNVIQLYSVLLLQLESTTDFLWLSDIVDQHWNGSPENTDYAGFYSALTEPFKSKENSESDFFSELSVPFLTAVYDQFFDSNKDYSRETHDEGLRQLANILRQSRETIAVREDISKPMQVIRTVRSIINRLNNSGIVFDNGMDSIITSSSEHDLINRNEKIVLRGSLNGERKINLSMIPGGKALNLTIYTDKSIDEIINAVEYDVYEPIQGVAPPAGKTYGYYYHENQRITFSNFTQYKMGGTLDIIMKNCGIPL